MRVGGFPLVILPESIVNRSNRHRVGFSVVELLVCIAVLAVLVALLLPAVQSARESARRVECSNRFRQIGIALHGFEERQKSFPIDGGPWLFNTASQTRFEGGYSVMAQLMGDLGQGPVASLVNVSVRNHIPWDEEPDIAMLRCPSDPADSVGLNYRVCYGLDSGQQTTQSADRLEGMFRNGDSRLIREMTDGTSHTVAVSERIRSDIDMTSYTPAEDIVGSGAILLYGLNQITADETLDICRSVTGATTGYSGQVGWSWTHSADFQTKYNHIAPPNYIVPDCSLDPLSSSIPGRVSISSNGGLVSARSYHRGGVNCLLADGSARFISSSIDLGLWRALATIAGSEVIGEF